MKLTNVKVSDETAWKIAAIEEDENSGYQSKVHVMTALLADAVSKKYLSIIKNKEKQNGK